MVSGHLWASPTPGFRRERSEERERGQRQLPGSVCPRSFQASCLHSSLFDHARSRACIDWFSTATGFFFLFSSLFNLLQPVGLVLAFRPGLLWLLHLVTAEADGANKCESHHMGRLSGS